MVVPVPVPKIVSGMGPSGLRSGKNGLGPDQTELPQHYILRKLYRCFERQISTEVCGCTFLLANPKIPTQGYIPPRGYGYGLGHGVHMDTQGFTPVLPYSQSYIGNIILCVCNLTLEEGIQLLELLHLFVLALEE